MPRTPTRPPSSARASGTRPASARPASARLATDGARLATGGATTAPARQGLRAELREFKRERILQAARRLFQERGFAGTSMEALANELSVAKPFLYQFFEGKEAILAEIYRLEAERLFELLEEARRDRAAPQDRLYRFVSAFVRENIAYQPITSMYLQEERRLPAALLLQVRERQKQFDRQLAELIAEGVRAGAFAVPAPKLASLAISGMVLWVQRWYRPDGELRADDICHHYACLALNMVRFAGEPPGQG